MKKVLATAGKVFLIWMAFIAALAGGWALGEQMAKSASPGCHMNCPCSSCECVNCKTNGGCAVPRSE